MQLAMTKAKASLQRYNQLFLLVAVLIIATVISRGVFMRPTNLMVVTASAAAFGLVSFGQALVVIGGGFDLAVGSLVAMSISAIVFFRADFGIVGGTIGALAAATVAGLISGVFVSRTKIPPFIVTLGMLSVADSMSWILAAGQPITVPEYNDAISPLFDSLPLGQNIFPIIILVVGFVATSLLLHRSKWGRYIYAIGDNEAAARIAGVPVMRTKAALLRLVGPLMRGWRDHLSLPEHQRDARRGRRLSPPEFRRDDPRRRLHVRGRGNHSRRACRSDLPRQHYKRADDCRRSTVDLSRRPWHHRSCSGALPGAITQIGCLELFGKALKPDRLTRSTEARKSAHEICSTPSSRRHASQFDASRSGQFR